MNTALKIQKPLPLLGQDYIDWFKSIKGWDPIYIPTGFNSEGKRIWISNKENNKHYKEQLQKEKELHKTENRQCVVLGED